LRRLHRKEHEVGATHDVPRIRQDRPRHDCAVVLHDQIEVFPGGATVELRHETRSCSAAATTVAIALGPTTATVISEDALDASLG
jgi:hypothetical protein